MPVTRPPRDVPGEILPGAVYTLQEFLARVGWSQPALKQAKRKGLKVPRIGPRSYVRGADFCRLVDRLVEEGGGQ